MFIQLFMHLLTDCLITVNMFCCIYKLSKFTQNYLKTQHYFIGNKKHYHNNFNFKKIYSLSGHPIGI